ncbi:MAG: carbohydrate-binding family 9-like protein [Planctomycetota bacterium]
MIHTTFFYLTLLALLTGCQSPNPRRYDCLHTSDHIHIDGRLDDTAWQHAPWTDAFVDIRGPSHPKPRYETRAKMLWDEKYLYIAAHLVEPHVWATLRNRDDIVFHDPDFEIFIDPDGDYRDYYEIEINAHNTIFDLLLVRTYRDGGPARIDWNLNGMHSAVFVDGTLNDPHDKDRGWSIEFALPWTALAEHANRPCPPNPGDTWRADFSRVEWRIDTSNGRYNKVPNASEDNWVWSPQGVVDMHIPQTWGYVRFLAADAPPVRLGGES